MATAIPNLPSSYTLVLAPADEREPDPAELTRVGQQIVGTLEREGWTVTPLYTGQRGGEVILQLVNQGLQIIETDVMAQQAAIGVLANLCTIIATLLPPVQHLFHIHQHPVTKPQAAAEAPLTITLTIDGASLTLTSADVAGDQRAMQLAERFLREHPSVTVTPQSQITLQTRVPKRNKPKKR